MTDPARPSETLTAEFIAQRVEEHIQERQKTGKTCSGSESKWMRSWPDLFRGGEPHPWYGPCDGFGRDDGCSECQRLAGCDVEPAPPAAEADALARPSLPLEVQAEQAMSNLGSACMLTDDPHLLKAINRAYSALRATTDALARVTAERDGYFKALNYDHGRLLEAERQLAEMTAERDRLKLAFQKLHFIECVWG